MFYILFNPPSLFVTLSADDLHWPELGMALESLSYDDSVNKGSFSPNTRSDLLMTTIHFERRLTALLKYILNGKPKPLGEIKDYFIRVEFQSVDVLINTFFWGQRNM